MKMVQNDAGIWVPKEKPKPPPKPERLKEWDCPNCGEHYDTRLQENEEYTVGVILVDKYIPHIICPDCKECMGCGQC